MAEFEDSVAVGSSLEASDACYLYEPAFAATEDAQPVKKRKVSRAIDPRLELLQHSDIELPNLFDGLERQEFAQARRKAFTTLWERKQSKLEAVLDEANAETTSRICDFVTTATTEGLSRQLPAGLINAGLASSATGSMFGSVVDGLRGNDENVIFRINASECHNLKASLKTIIQRATTLRDADSDDEELVVREGRLLLNYDLQALHNHVRNRSIQRCVVFFQNSEALDPQVLTDLVDVLSSWQDRIPFVLLFEMAISVDLFQEKLSKSTIRQLRGALFESKPASEILDILFFAATAVGDHTLLLIGPSVSKMLLDKQTDQIASAKGFISALKYCYMMHFFNNPLSFLCDEFRSTLQREHADFVRELPSFKRYIDTLSGDGHTAEARKLLKDPKHLLSQVQPILEQSRATLRGIQQSLEILRTVNEYTSLRLNLTYSSLYIKALAGELVDSPILRELILSIRKLPADRMLALLLQLQSQALLEAADLEPIISLLSELTAKTSTTLYSTHGASSDAVVTAVQGKKVVLDKSKEKPSAGAVAYTKLIERIDLLLVANMAKTLVAPRDIPLHEVLVFDGKAAVRPALGSAPRAALERALARPHDYLACTCCDVPEGQLAPTQPATALVYQLYLESGATINVQDLWLAFRAIMGPEGGGNGDEDEGDEENDLTLALFHRALAELRYIGMLRNNKRKADHLAKVRWKGL